MSESEIRDRIKTLENQKLQYSSWVSYNSGSNSVSYEEIQRVLAYIEKLEKEINDLYDDLKTAQNLPKQEDPIMTSTLNENNYTSDNKAIQAQDEARNRFYGMSKLRQSIAKITGKKKKFEALANRAYDGMTPQEEQALTNEINRMFR